MAAATGSPVNFKACGALIACPCCGYSSPLADQAEAGSGECPQCRVPWKFGAGVWEWQDTSVEENPTQRTFGKLIKLLLNPLTSPFSPLSLLTRVRVERFYQRTLVDRQLAADWGAHYLSGLDLPAGARVLDHGCGRGRNIGLMKQLGYSVCGQEVGQPHAWWQQFSEPCFQVVAPNHERLPWVTEGFDLVLDVMVIHHLTGPQLEKHASEVFRVLRPGRYWLLLEANSSGYAAHLPRSHCGRLHTLEAVADIARSAGFRELDVSFEGFYAPILPTMINFLRQQLAPWPLDISDYRSFLAKCIPPERRGLWLLRLQKPRS